MVFKAGIFAVFLGGCLLGQTDDSEGSLVEAWKQASHKEPNGLLAASYAHNLAVHYDHAGRSDEAEKYYRTALRIWKSNPSAGVTRVAVTATCLVTMFLRNGRIAAGDSLLRSPLNTKIESLGSTNPEVIRWRNLKAAVLVQRGKNKEAEPVLLKLIEDLQSHSDPDDPELAVALHSLGLAYQATARLPEALDCFNRSAAIAGKTKDPGRFRPLLCAAGIHARLQHYQQAEDMFESVLRNIGSDHPMRAEALSQYADALRRMDKRAEAKKMEKEAKSIIGAKPQDASVRHTIDITELSPRG